MVNSRSSSPVAAWMTRTCRSWTSSRTWVSGRLRVGFYGTDELGFTVTRADIAAFPAAQVDDPRYVGAAPGISS